MFDLTQGGVCLLLIDMQNEFLSEKGYFAVKQGWPVETFRDKIDHCVALRKAARESGCKVIYTATGYAPDGSDAYVARHSILPLLFLEPDGRPRKPDAAVLQGSWGAQIIDELAPDASDYVVHKQRFNAFYQTELELMLRCWDIRTLIVCGMITEVCVESTIREAFIRDFDVLEVSDGVGSWSPERHEASLRAVNFSYGRVTDTASVLDMLAARRRALGL
ncbi:MAG: cysteine hydrolase [Clostridia bacterium]|nr:cysteine hydrolase [Clostridia bacterium]